MEKIYYLRPWRKRQTKPSNTLDLFNLNKNYIFTIMEDAKTQKEELKSRGIKSDIVILNRYLYIDL